MNTAVREAHLRMLARLTVHTHHCPGPVMKQKGERYSAAEKDRLRAKLLELQDAGHTRFEMCVEMGTTGKTIRRLLGPARVHC